MTQVDEQALVRKMTWRVRPILLLTCPICLFGGFDRHGCRRAQRRVACPVISTLHLPRTPCYTRRILVRRKNFRPRVDRSRRPRPSRNARQAPCLSPWLQRSSLVAIVARSV